MVTTRTKAVVDAAIALLVDAAPDSTAIGQSLERAMLPAIKELLEQSYFKVHMAQSRLYGARHSGDDESESSAEELAKCDLVALEFDLQDARVEFQRTLTTSLNLINGFRRFREKEEFAPKDTSELLNLLRMVLDFPSEDELTLTNDYMGLGFELEVRRADVPGIPHAAFEISASRYQGKREDYGYEGNDILF